MKIALTRILRRRYQLPSGRLFVVVVVIVLLSLFVVVAVFIKKYLIAS